ncbi:hypothetical protein TRFO_09991 [Tritrichomonas foetus]|uniref:Uncharacterized protein n=1 Tax=Tritrichomonas foetus TaxID=1144522 RepID=A0A1J4JDI1_9EUKA|nr:hypothetical protein TRFO_09991 [Tritrichomonas foetus]|eukprot:OHS96343.1 hypothetical protein TRFO_09991 [Tritrichomonas foetus]
MGCASSKVGKPRVTPRKRPNNANSQSTNLNTTSHKNVGNNITLYTSMSAADAIMFYDFITRGVTTIKGPPGMVPVLCLTLDTMPLVVASPIVRTGSFFDGMDSFRAKQDTERDAANGRIDMQKDLKMNEGNRVQNGLENGGETNLIGSSKLSKKNLNRNNDESQAVVDSGNNIAYNNSSNNTSRKSNLDRKNTTNNIPVNNSPLANRNTDNYKNDEYFPSIQNPHFTRSQKPINKAQNEGEIDQSKDDYDVFFQDEIDEFEVEPEPSTGKKISAFKSTRLKKNRKGTKIIPDNFMQNHEPDFPSIQMSINSSRNTNPNDDGQMFDAYSSTTPDVFEKTEPDYLYSAIVAVATVSTGQIYCFSHIQMLSPSLMETDQTVLLYRNIINYVNLKENVIAQALLVDPLNRIFPEIRHYFNRHGIVLEEMSKFTKMNRYQLLVVYSDVKLDQDLIIKLKNYVLSGGTIFCFYIPADPDNPKIVYTPINELLVQFGIAFGRTQLNSHLGGITTVKIPKSIMDMPGANFMCITDTYFNEISKTDFDPEVLDDIVSHLRDYILSCEDESFYQELLKILKASFTFLQKTKYRDSKSRLLFHEIYHGIVAVVIQDIYDKLPIDRMEKNPDCDIFPDIYMSPRMAPSSWER